MIAQRIKHPCSVRPGFSLMEIIIAIAIVGIMMGISIQAFRYLKNASKTQARSTLQELRLAIEEFRAHTGTYPRTLDDLVSRPADKALAEKWQGSYLDAISNDPWGNSFVYSVNPPRHKPPYELYSWGPDGEGSPDTQWVRIAGA